MKDYEVQIYAPKDLSHDWYVYIYDTNDRKIIKKFYKGLKRADNYLDRMATAMNLKRAIKLEMKDGWRPDGSGSLLTSKRIPDAFKAALQSLQLNLSPRTYKAYSGTVNAFLYAIEALRFENVTAENFTRAHAKKCLEYIREKRNWSAHNYNKNLGYIRSVFTEIIESDQAQTNPFRDIRNLKVTKTEANIPPTDEEMAKICSELKDKNFGFLYFLHDDLLLRNPPGRTAKFKSKAFGFLPENH